jgi:hypothetical protein
MCSVPGVCGRGFGRGRYRRSGFWFELVATDGAVGAAQVSWFQGRLREPKTADTYFGSCGAGGGVNGLGGVGRGHEEPGGLELAVEEEG